MRSSTCSCLYWFLHAIWRSRGTSRFEITELEVLPDWILLRRRPTKITLRIYRGAGGDFLVNTLGKNFRHALVQFWCVVSGHARADAASAQAVAPKQTRAATASAQSEAEAKRHRSRQTSCCPGALESVTFEILVGAGAVAGARSFLSIDDNNT